MKPANSIFSACGTTIFEVMSRLAVEHGAVNLGQGFPEGLEPPALLQAAARAVIENDRAMEAPPGWVVTKSKRYGTTLVTMLESTGPLA